VCECSGSDREVRRRAQAFADRGESRPRQITICRKIRGLHVSCSWSAKPLYVGSNPTRASKSLNNSYLGKELEFENVELPASRRTKSGLLNSTDSISLSAVTVGTDLSTTNLSPL